jgi:hypothetical protein
MGLLQKSPDCEDCFQGIVKMSLFPLLGCFGQRNTCYLSLQDVPLVRRFDQQTLALHAITRHGRTVEPVRSQHDGDSSVVQDELLVRQFE